MQFTGKPKSTARNVQIGIFSFIATIVSVYTPFTTIVAAIGFAIFVSYTTDKLIIKDIHVCAQKACIFDQSINAIWWISLGATPLLMLTNLASVTTIGLAIAAVAVGVNANVYIRRTTNG